MTTMTAPRQVRQYNPEQGCAWCGKPFRPFTNRTVPPARFYPIFVRRTIKYLGDKIRVTGCVCGNCDEFLMEHQYSVRIKPQPETEQE